MPKLRKEKVFRKTRFGRNGDFCDDDDSFYSVRKEIQLSSRYRVGTDWKRLERTYVFRVLGTIEENLIRNTNVYLTKKHTNTL